MLVSAVIATTIFFVVCLYLLPNSPTQDRVLLALMFLLLSYMFGLRTRFGDGPSTKHTGLQMFLVALLLILFVVIVTIFYPF